MALRYFQVSEFSCKGSNCCGGANLMQSAFLEELDELRHRCGFPFVITSGFRCPVHNARVSSTGSTGPHTTGRAADIAVSHERATEVLQHALAMKFTGFGVNQKGGGRFLHLDTLGRPTRTIWSY